jgi:nucleoid-associated protein YgaU
VVIVSLLAVSLMAMAMAGAVAIGRGGLADLAPASPTSGAPAPSSGAAPAGVAAGAEVVVVEPGDTLWSIARRVEPTGDVRPVVDRLVAANGSTVIVPGQELVVPR